MDRAVIPAGAVGQAAVLAVTVVTDELTRCAGRRGINGSDPLAFPLAVITMAVGRTVAVGNTVVDKEAVGTIRLGGIAVNVGGREIAGDIHAGVATGAGAASAEVVVMGRGIHCLVQAGGVVLAGLAAVGTAVAIDTRQMDSAAGPVTGGVGKMAGVGAGLGARDVADRIIKNPVFVTGVSAGSGVGAVTGGAGIRHIAAVGRVVPGMLAAGHRIAGETVVNVQRLAGRCMAISAVEGHTGKPVTRVDDIVASVGAGTGAGVVDADLGRDCDGIDVRAVEVAVGNTNGAAVTMTVDTTAADISGVEHVLVMLAGVRADGSAHVGFTAGVQALGGAMAIGTGEVNRHVGPVAIGVGDMAGVGAGAAATGVERDTGGDSLAAVTVTDMGAEIGVAAVAGIAVTGRGRADVDVVVAMDSVLAADRRIRIELTENLRPGSMAIGTLVGTESAGCPLAIIGIVTTVGGAAVGIGEIGAGVIDRGGQIGAAEVDGSVVMVGAARPRVGVAGFTTAGKERRPFVQQVNRYAFIGTEVGTTIGIMAIVTVCRRAGLRGTGPFSGRIGEFMTTVAGAAGGDMTASTTDGGAVVNEADGVIDLDTVVAMFGGEVVVSRVAGFVGVTDVALVGRIVVRRNLATGIATGGGLVTGHDTGSESGGEGAVTVTALRPVTILGSRAPLPFPDPLIGVTTCQCTVRPTSRGCAAELVDRGGKVGLGTAQRPGLMGTGRGGGVTSDAITGRTHLILSDLEGIIVGVARDGQCSGMETARRYCTDPADGMTIDTGEGTAICPVTSGVGNMAGDGTGLRSNSVGHTVFHQIVLVAGMGSIPGVETVAISAVAGDVEVVVNVREMLGGVRRICGQISFELGGGMTIGASQGGSRGPVATINHSMAVIGTSTGTGIPGGDLVGQGLDAVIVGGEVI